MHFRPTTVLQVYGSTETCPIAIYTRLGGDLTRRCSIGLPGLLGEARIVNADGNDVPANVPGEILIRGDNVLSEYWGNEVAAADVPRWLVLDRRHRAARRRRLRQRAGARAKSDHIGGENVYPAEIAHVLQQHPAVLEAAAIGVPDPRWQEVPLAFVVLRAGVTTTMEELHVHLAAHLARFKPPRNIAISPELPRCPGQGAAFSAA